MAMESTAETTTMMVRKDFFSGIREFRKLTCVVLAVHYHQQLLLSTIVNLIFAFILGWGLLRGKSYLKLLMGEVLPMTDEGWMIFTRRWVFFFIAMAVLNEAIWRTQTEDFWVSFKTFGSPAITFVFMMSQMGLLNRHAPPEEKG